MDIENINLNIIASSRKVIHKDRWGAEGFTPLVNKLYYIYEGKMAYSINGHHSIATAGDWILMPLNTTQSFCLISESVDHFYCHFTLTLNDGIDLFSTHQYDSQINLHRIPLENMNPTMPHSFQKHHEIMNVLYAYMNQSSIKKKCSKNTYTPALQEIATYIQNNIKTKITIDDLAHAANLHPNYLIRLFKRNYGMSPIHYINALKINLAKDELNYTDHAIGHIADSLGFNDIYYFSRLFKKLTGMSPKQYRK